MEILNYGLVIFFRISDFFWIEIWMEMFWFIQRFIYQFLWFRILLRFWITDVFVEALDRNFLGNGFFLFMSTFSKDHRHGKLLIMF